MAAIVSVWVLFGSAEVWTRAHNLFSVNVHIVQEQLLLKFINLVEGPVKDFNLFHDFWVVPANS